MKKKKILVLGGGFGGVRAALALSKIAGVTVQLISDRSDFRYYPALYRYVVGHPHLEAFIPLQDVLVGNRSVELSIEQALSIDADNKTVITNVGSHSYDYLIVALGNVTNYFGIPGLQEFSYGIKSIEESRRLRHHLHEELLDENKPDLNYVVVGAGPTGVEMAAALTSYIKRIISLHGLKNQNYHIDLVEAAERVLPRMPIDISKSVQRRLQQLGVSLYLDTAVQGETADSIKFKNETLTSKTVIWTAGVTSNPFIKENVGVFKLDKHGRVEIDSRLSVGRDIYVIGDNAATEYSGLAQTAIYDADFVADNLQRIIYGRKQQAYVSKRPIYVIPVGFRWAAVLWGNVRIYGLPGWLLRRLADLVAYKDIESMGQAWRSWLADTKYEEDCSICSGGEKAIIS